MAWTAPRTWVAGEVVTAALMNTHVRDNLLEALQRDGSVALTAAWDAGSYQIRAETFQSDIATGTAPLTVASTTVVTNLNADLIDGQSRALTINADHTHLSTGAQGGILRKLVVLKVIADSTTLTTGNGKMYWTVPLALNGMDLIDADAAVYTVSSSGLPTVQIHNLTQAADMLSTLITLDTSEFNSYTAATPPVIDTANDDVATGDRIRIDVDVAGTGTTGLEVILVFAIP